VFISWTDTERRRIALDVAAGRLSRELATALLNGWLEQEDSDHDLEQRYAEVCSLLSIPIVQFIHYVTPELSPKEFFGVHFRLPDDQVLSETGVQHLRESAKALGGYVAKLSTDIGQFGFFREEQARSFLREVLHVLSSTVFRKAS